MSCCSKNATLLLTLISWPGPDLHMVVDELRDLAEGSCSADCPDNREVAQPENPLDRLAEAFDTSPSPLPADSKGNSVEDKTQLDGFITRSTLEFVNEVKLLDFTGLPDEGTWDCPDNPEHEVALTELPRLDSVNASGVLLAAESAGSILQHCSAEEPQPALAVLPSNKRHPEAGGTSGPLVDSSHLSTASSRQTGLPVKEAPPSNLRLPPQATAPGTSQKKNKRKRKSFAEAKRPKISKAVHDHFQLGGCLILEDINPSLKKASKTERAGMWGVFAPCGIKTQQ